MDKITEAFVTIVGLVIGVATLSVIVSQKSNAGGIIQNLFSGVGNLLAVATGPVTGTSVTPNLGYSNVGGFGSIPGAANLFNPSFNNTGG